MGDFFCILKSSQFCNKSYLIYFAPGPSFRQIKWLVFLRNLRQWLLLFQLAFGNKPLLFHLNLRKKLLRRAFLRTLLHEVGHHLDYELLKLRESFHTEGFFRRESSLFRQLVPEAAVAPPQDSESRPPGRK